MWLEGLTPVVQAPRVGALGAQRRATVDPCLTRGLAWVLDKLTTYANLREFHNYVEYARGLQGDDASGASVAQLKSLFEKSGKKYLARSHWSRTSP